VAVFRPLSRCAVTSLGPDPLSPRTSRLPTKEVPMVGTLLVIALLLLLFGVIGGIAISKFLFLILIVAAVVGLFSLLSGRTA
jgi:hypothetical protein